MFDKWNYSTVKQTNEGQYKYAFVYIYLSLEKHMAMNVRTISWKYKAKYDFEWWINKRDHNSWKYFLKQISCLFFVVYKERHSRSTYHILRTTRGNSWEIVYPTWRIRLRVGMWEINEISEQDALSKFTVAMCLRVKLPSKKNTRGILSIKRIGLGAPFIMKKCILYALYQSLFEINFHRASPLLGISVSSYFPKQYL